MSELVKFLKQAAGDNEGLCYEAADAIERLTAERDRLAADLAEARELLEEWRDDGMPMTQTDLFLSRTEGK
jgi:hypothetical protein